MYAGVIIFSVLLLQVLCPGVQSQSGTVQRSAVESYVRENQRIYADNVAKYEEQIADLKFTYLAQLRALDTHSQLIEARLLEAEDYLTPLEMLSDLNRYCVDKYRDDIPKAVALKATLTECTTSALSSWSILINTAESLKWTLNNYYATTLKASLDKCAENTVVMRYSNCATEAIASANKFTTTSRRQFATAMQFAKGNIDLRVDQALDCGFTPLFEAISDIATALRSVDECINGRENCASSE